MAENLIELSYARVETRHALTVAVYAAYADAEAMLPPTINEAVEADRAANKALSDAMKASAKRYDVTPKTDDDCAHSFGVHDCALSGGHDGPHECDPDCGLGH